MLTCLITTPGSRFLIIIVISLHNIQQLHTNHITNNLLYNIWRLNGSWLKHENIAQRNPRKRKEKIEDTKRVTRCCNLKDTQYNGQKKNQNDKQWSTKHNTENKRLSNTNLTNNRDELMCSVRISCSYSTGHQKLNFRKDTRTSESFSTT